MNLEKELIALSNSIMFDDADGSHQLDTYSPKISELLLRCAIEIESISKDLYYLNGGKRKYNKKKEEIEPKFDYECLKFLDDQWQICSKKILASSANFYFTKLENKSIVPLSGVCIKNGCSWNSAYQAIKHYRATSMKKATVKNLIHAMAALYLLNIYYKNEEKLYRFMKYDNTASLGSEVFSVEFHQSTQMGSNVFHTTGKAFPNFVYIRKYTDQSIQCIVEEWFETHKEMYKTAKDILPKKPELKEFFDNGGTLCQEHLHLIFQCLGKPLLNKMNELKTFTEKKKFVENRLHFSSISQQAIEQVFPNRHIHFLNKEISKDNIEEICIILGAFEANQIINSEYVLSDTPEYKQYMANGGVFDVEHLRDIVEYFGKQLLDEMNKLSALNEKIDFLIKRPRYAARKTAFPQELKVIFKDKSIEFDGKNITDENIEQICLIVGIDELLLKQQTKQPSLPVDVWSKPTEIVLNKGQKLYDKIILPENWIF